MKVKNTILNSFKFNNSKIIDVTGDNYSFTIKFKENDNTLELVFDDYDIDNDYPLYNRNIYSLECLTNEDNLYNMNFLIWMKDNSLIEKVSITSKNIIIRKYIKDKLKKECDLSK